MIMSVFTDFILIYLHKHTWSCMFTHQPTVLLLCILYIVTVQIYILNLICEYSVI